MGAGGRGPGLSASRSARRFTTPTPVPRPPAPAMVERHRRAIMAVMRRALPLALVAVTLLPAQKQPFDVNALLKIARIGEPADLPGRQAGRLHRATHGRGRQQAQPPASTWSRWPGGAPRQITQAGDNNERPRWSPDSKQIAFISDRGGSPQIWMMDADGANPRQVTSLSTERRRRARSPPTARTWSSPATSIRSAAPTTPATRSGSTRTRTARSRRASTPSCSTATGPTGRRPRAATCSWCRWPAARRRT